MQSVKVSTEIAGTFLLSGQLNRNTVPACWSNSVADIKQAASQQPVIIDMSGISEVDTAGLAWLINLLRDCAAQNLRFTLSAVPTTLINLAKISDVEGFLPLQ